MCAEEAMLFVKGATNSMGSRSSALGFSGLEDGGEKERTSLFGVFSKVKGLYRQIPCCWASLTGPQAWRETQDWASAWDSLQK